MQWHGFILNPIQSNLGDYMAIKRSAADKWFSDAIRHAAGYQCEHCQKSFPTLVQGFEACHIYSRRNRNTRWCVENCVALCGGCHRLMTENPIMFSDFLLSEYGSGRLEILREKHNQPKLVTNKIIEAQISKHYREEFRRMTSFGTTDLVSWH